MARVDNLENFLTDVAGAIREKKGTQDQIPAENFDTEIKSITSGLDTSDATATADDIINPKTAYVNGKKITGSILPTYEPGEITGTEISSTVTSDYGISFLLPDNSTMMFINKSVAYLKLSNGEIISKNIDLGNYYPHQAEIAELPYEGNKHYFAICSYSSAGQSGENRARIDIFSIDLDVLSTNVNAIELEPIKTLSGLYMSWNQGCFTFAKQNGNILAYMERNYTHNLVSIYQISIDNYLVQSKDLGYKELDPDFLKFMNNDRLLVSYVTGYDYNWIFNLTDYTIDSYTLLGYNTKISTLDGVNYFYSYSINNTSKNELHYGTYDLTNGTTTSAASTSFSTNILDINILYKNENIYYVGVYCDNNMYLLKYDVNTKLFTVLNSINGYGSIKENTVLSYGYNVLLHSMWSGKENLTLGLTVNVEPTDKITSLIKENIRYYNTSNATVVAENIIKDEVAYGKDGKLIGTIPNNGELNYTPSSTAQTIPAGYTSGGKINPMDVTTSTIYKQAITILKDIKPTVSAIYKQIDYIGGTGSQRLYTDIQTDSATDTYEITLRDTDVANWEYYFQLGVMRLSRYQTRSTEFCFMAGTNRVGESFTLGNINDGNWHTIKITPNALSFDGSQKISYSVGGTSTGAINIFYPGDTTSSFLVKEFKMYRAGELISHLIPCENIQTNTVGMYDLIGNKFYNNTGSGTFTSGNTIGDIDVEDYTLKQRLLDLQDYINQNIVPANIRADKTIFDVTGTAPVTFSTIEEMNKHTDLAEDTFAIVYGTSYVGTYRLNNGVWAQIGVTGTYTGEENSSEKIN